MKKIIIVLLIVLIPLVVMSRAFDFNNAKLNKIFPNTKFADRLWRLNQVVEETYTGAAWENEGRNIYVYNSVFPTRLDTLVYSQWDSNSQAWITFMKTSYTYDATNEYVTDALALVNFGTGYTPYVQYFFTYDNQNRVTSQRIYFMNFDTSQWGLFMRFELFYVSNSDYTVHSYMAAGDEDPEQWTRMNFTWDAQGRIITETDTSSPDSLTWTNDRRHTVTYHQNDTTTGDSFVNNLAHTMWMQQTDGYEYISGNMFGMVAQEVSQNWENGMWVYDNQDVYTYDTADKLIQRNSNSWNSMQSQWNNNERVLYGYDTNNNMFLVVSAYWDGFISEYQDDTRFVLTWGQDTANDDNTAPAFNGLSLSVAPNPFMNETNIAFSSKDALNGKVFIYNLKGQLINEFTVKSNASLNWDGTDKNNVPVTNGIYFVKAVSGNSSTTIKILKLK